MSNLNLTVSASEHTRFDHHYHPPAGQPSGSDQLAAERFAYLHVEFGPDVRVTVKGPAPQLVELCDTLAAYAHQTFDLPEPCPCPGGTQCDCAVLA